MTRKPNRSVVDGGVLFEDPPTGIVVVAAERSVVELDVASEDVVDMAAWNVCRSAENKDTIELRMTRPGKSAGLNAL